MTSLSMFKKKDEEEILKIQELPNEMGLIIKCMLYILDEKFNEYLNNKQLFEILVNIIKKKGEKNFNSLFANYFEQNKFLNLTYIKVDNINKIIN